MKKKHTELKQRIFNLDTLHGLYLVPLAIVGLYFVYAHPEFMLHVLCIAFFTLCLVEGLHRIFINPVKREAMKVLSRESYIANNFDTRHKRA